MDICYASNEAYVPYLTVSLCSLLRANRNAGALRVHIISNGIKEESKARIREDAKRAWQSDKRTNAVNASSAVKPQNGASLASSKGKETESKATENKVKSPLEQAGEASVFFYELADLPARLGKEIDTGQYDISMLGRFFIGELLPKEVERLLYLDCDTLLQGSLLPLFEERGDSLSEAAAAAASEGKPPMLYAVEEPTIYRSIKKQLGLSGKGQFYVNSGVLLINMPRWREERAGERLLSFYRENGSRLFCGDQDAINYVLKGNIGWLSPTYNFFTNYYYFRYKTLCRLSETYSKAVPNEEAFLRIRKAPVILHYMGAERPWILGNRNPYRKEWEQVLAETSFAGMEPLGGKEKFMRLYHWMNLCTGVCPPLRRAVSGMYERKLVKPRTKELLIRTS